MSLYGYYADFTLVFGVFIVKFHFIVNFKNTLLIHHTMAKTKDKKDRNVSKIQKSTIKKVDRTSAVKSLDKSKTPILKLNNLKEILTYYELSEENLSPGMILHKMSEILELYLKILQQILQPEEFHSLRECAIFDDDEKIKLFELYSRIIIAHREILKALILNEEKNYLTTVDFIHKEILGVKPMMLDVVKKMQHSWKAEKKTDVYKGSARYFG